MEPKEALQRAIEELASQRAEIERLRRETREPIAVVGMACRFPGASSIEEYWDLLARGGDAVTEVPPERWCADAFFDADPAAVGKMATRRGAFIAGVDRFDPQFFGIAPREAQNMDPQQRILLEVAWEALENANIAPTGLYGTAAGVFIGITCFDHAIRMSQAAANFNAYAGTGSALNMAPGRLSYVLGLTGPSLAVDTACSSSLVCLHLACQSLRQRETNLALVGGAHLILSPHVMVSFSQARMLAPDGHSKTFDASADGYSRGEGCGVVVLKRLGEALSDGDSILGVIRGSAVNQDGPSGGLTVPNGVSQQQVIRRALDAAGVPPAAVHYVEAHGTGTSLGDPIEVEALANVYGTDRPPERPLLIGSVKTNIGHLEPAAGMAGLIKVLLAFQHSEIPRHLHFQTPNPHIPWSRVPVKVAGDPSPWPRTGQPRRAGLSAFGFSGTNAHVIVEEPPTVAGTAPAARALHLLVLSAKSDAALKEMAGRYAVMLRQRPGQDLASLCHTVARGRAHFAHRLTALVTSAEEARQMLEAFVSGQTTDLVRSGKATPADYRRDGKDVTERLQRAYEQLGRNDGDHHEALRDVAALYLSGAAIDWPRLYGAPAPLPAVLPTYPFQRQRYWIDTPDQAPAADTNRPGFYQLLWIDQGAAATRIDVGPDRRWCIVPGDREFAERVQRVLAARGAMASLADEHEAANSGATDIVFVAGPDSPDAAIGSCLQLLALIQAVLDRRGSAPRIWVATRGALPVAGDVTRAGALHAPVAAFARVLGLEHPELFGRLIDLDSALAWDDAELLIAEILQDSAEDQVAIRQSQRYAQRIDHLTDEPSPPLTLSAESAYLITGGLGKIGLQVAADLARRGARHLCLLARHGVSTAEQRSALSAIEAQGVSVRIATADVADRAAMAVLLRDLTAGPPLRGVVHLAGVPGYADLEQLTAAAVAAVLRPKIHGAAILNDLTRDLALDFFVSFSSIASAWGSRGQAHYAAANAYLDALAYLRRGSDRPATTINWGPWAGGGMTSREAETLLRRVGIRPLIADRALAAMGTFATGSRAQVVVADVDWALFRGSYEARGHRRLLERLHTEPAAIVAPADTELARQLAATPAADRERLLIGIIQREVAQVLALSDVSQADPDQGLFEMGVDSLMSLELRTRLQTLVARALPSTLVFDCPTIQSMARFLVRELTGRTAAAVPIAPTAVPADASNLDALSDDEAEALLLEKLESIH